jgi:hypothetical protein
MAGLPTCLWGGSVRRRLPGAMGKGFLGLGLPFPLVFRVGFEESCVLYDIELVVMKWSEAEDDERELDLQTSAHISLANHECDAINLSS